MPPAMSAAPVKSRLRDLLVQLPQPHRLVIGGVAPFVVGRLDIPVELKVVVIQGVDEQVVLRSEFWQPVAGWHRCRRVLGQPRSCRLDFR